MHIFNKSGTLERRIIPVETMKSCAVTSFYMDYRGCYYLVQKTEVRVYSGEGELLRALDTSGQFTTLCGVCVDESSNIIGLGCGDSYAISVYNIN